MLRLIRPLSAFFAFALPCTTILIAAADTLVQGTVVDASGRGVPRALVVVRNSSGREIGQGFTYPDGTFRVSADTGSGCRLEVGLSGFKTTTAGCGDSKVKLVLEVAPVSEAVVVSATRSEAPAGQLASSISVFDAADLERQQHPPLADVLRSAPGVAIVGAGTRGAVTSLFLRGGESNYTKVLLDGIPLNEPGGTFDFGNVTTERLSRVELVRGAQSALFGSDAMSGVIQMFTARAAAGEPAVDVSVEGGSFGTGRISAGAAGRAGAFDYAVGAARYATENDVPNSDFDNTTLSGSAGVEINPRTSIRFTGRAELGKAGTPGQAAFGRPDLDAAYERRNGVGGVTFQQTVNDAFTQRATYALSTVHQTSTNLVEDPPYTPSYGDSVAPFEFFDFPYDSKNDIRRHYASYQADWRLPSGAGAAGTHLLTFAFDWDGERGDFTDRMAATTTSASRNNVGWTIQDQAMWSRVFVTGGLRIEHNDSFGSAVVPRGSIAFIAHRSDAGVGDTKLKASAGLGIKEPTLLQSFSASPFFLGNPDLEPERSRSLEAGIEQRLFGNRARVELTWFGNRYRDIISTDTISFDPFVSQYFNIGLTEARGVELSAEAAPAAGVSVRGGYTRLDSEILESTSAFSPVFAVGQPLFRRPQNSGYAELSWTHDRLSIGLTGVFVGERTDSDFSSLEPPLVSNDGYARWDLRASVGVTKILSITGAIDNLTGADYMDPLGYPALGAGARLGAKVRF